jgi:cyclic dehypoxanthinyl futalosine synthase
MSVAPVEAPFLAAPAAPGMGGDRSVRAILENAVKGKRITRAEALTLFEKAPLLELAEAAHAIRLRLHPDGRATYQVDRNINYTNVCVYRCTFCAFYRTPSDADSYVLSFEEIGQKVEETLALGGTGVLLQGGVHAELPLSYYQDLLSFLREKYPRIHRHAFSAPEVFFIAKKEKMSIRAVLEKLKEAGLMSVPGGGAEILDNEVRKRIWALTKAPVEKWAEVHRESHGIGLPTTATMMFGVGESYEQRLNHIEVVREIQDESLKAGSESFTAFIPWTFQEENTAMDGTVETSGGYDYLRTLALSRIFLDNVSHIQGSWVTQGKKLGQISLFHGADDLGSIMIEENVVAAAGAHNRMTEADMIALISDAGFAPRKRGSVYDRCHEPCCAEMNGR